MITLTPLQRRKYEEFMKWLITPQDEREQTIFKEKGLVDDYITILNSIPHKTDEELLDSIDNSLSNWNLELDRDNLDFPTDISKLKNKIH
jgi:hypothetical protein